MSAVKILIVDDHPTTREGIIRLLSGGSRLDMIVVGEAGTADEAITAVRHLHPDLVIMDISLPGGTSGLDASRLIKEEFPHIKILLFSFHDERHWLAAFERSGASGYVHKSAVGRDLIRAIEEVNAGNRFVSAIVVNTLLGYERDGKTPLPATTLTETEIIVLTLIASGKTNLEIAHEMVLSIKTIEKHRQNICTKLDRHNLADLTRFAIANGYIEAI